MRKGVSLGLSLILLPILPFSSQTGILRVLYYRNYCIDLNQILPNSRDHQVVIVGGPNTRPTNPRWWTAAILQNPLNRHISATF